jgi:hypothetical protein
VARGELCKRWRIEVAKGLVGFPVCTIDFLGVLGAAIVCIDLYAASDGIDIIEQLKTAELANGGEGAGVVGFGLQAPGRDTGGEQGCVPWSGVKAEACDLIGDQ